MKIVKIMSRERHGEKKVKIFLNNGEMVKAIFTPIGWEQWGASLQSLSFTIGTLSKQYPIWLENQ